MICYLCAACFLGFVMKHVITTMVCKPRPQVSKPPQTTCAASDDPRSAAQDVSHMERHRIRTCEMVATTILLALYKRICQMTSFSSITVDPRSIGMSQNMQTDQLGGQLFAGQHLLKGIKLNTCVYSCCSDGDQGSITGQDILSVAVDMVRLPRNIPATGNNVGCANSCIATVSLELAMHWLQH